MLGLIDTTEMYLRTVYELEEEGVVPMRARIAERLRQTGPTVSETVARMERQGLLALAPDRHLELTAEGRELASAVMRKHRLAELLLIDVIGLPWEDVHIEACRWEHVISDAVEDRLVELLGDPAVCPHGNPIPGTAAEVPAEPLLTLGDAAGSTGAGIVRRISEQIQVDADLMGRLRRGGLRPGTEVKVETLPDGGVRVHHDSDTVELPAEVASHIWVAALPS